MEYSDKTDEELLQGYYLEKNPSFINAIFTRYADVGFRTAMQYVHNASDAEDVLQVAFIQFLQNVYSFREGTSTVKPWLMKMFIVVSILLSLIQFVLTANKPKALYNKTLI